MEVTVIFQRGSYLAIKFPPNAIHSWIVRLDEDVRGRHSETAGGCTHFDTNFSGTYLENVLSSRTKDSGRKVPRTIIIIIIDQVEMDEQEGDDGGVILQLAEEELKRLTNLLDPKADSDASSAKDDLEDCSDLGSVRKAVVRAAGYACDQPVVFLLPE